MPESATPCPHCGTDAAQVVTETVRNLFEPFRIEDVADDVQYRICKAQECEVDYFADELDQQYGTDMIRERPNFKLDAGAEPYPLCYCFGSDKAHGRADIADTGETTIDDWITERVQAEECACRYKSPLGSCCLGNVRKAIDETKEELAN